MKGNVRYLQPEKVRVLFLLCWVAYFISNLGRLNYSAVIAEIIQAEHFSNSAAGLVSTGFFFCYGLGQLASGYIGDKIPPKWMVFLGIACSGVLNLAMAFADTPGQMLLLWCGNGAAQSMIWAPILRIIAEYFPIAYRQRACVNMATTYPAAALLTYVGSAGIIAISSWRTVFLLTALALVATGFLWLFSLPVIERYRTVEVAEAAPAQEADLSQLADTRLPWGFLLVLGLILVVQGILRDGVMTWVPTYLNSSFQTGTTVSILSTTILPITNLLGVYAAGALHKRTRNETATSGVLFLIACVGAFCLLTAGQHSLAAALGSFSLITACMMGVNLMLVSFIPTYFTSIGKVSFVAGFVNSMVYVGSSIATYGIGRMADSLGWGALLGILLCVSLAGSLLSWVAVPFWRRVRGNL